MKTNLLTAMIATLVLFTWVCGPAWADDDKVIKQVDEALKLFKEGKYSQSASEFEFVVQQIRQIQAALMKGIFPKPPPGWAAGVPESNTAGAAFFGGGTSSSCGYTKGDSRVEIKMVSNSPVLQSYMMMFSNPMMMAGQGEIGKVAGNRTITKFDAASGNGDMNIVVANKILVTIEGFRLAAVEVLTTFAELIDYAGLEKLANN